MGLRGKEEYEKTSPSIIKFFGPSMVVTHTKYNNKSSSNIRTLYEATEGTSERLHKRIRLHSKPIVAALGNCDTSISYTYKRSKETPQ
jgi:hypothetical protein